MGYQKRRQYILGLKYLHVENFKEDESTGWESNPGPTSTGCHLEIRYQFRKPQ